MLYRVYLCFILELRRTKNKQNCPYYVFPSWSPTESIYGLILHPDSQLHFISQFMKNVDFFPSWLMPCLCISVIKDRLFWWWIVRLISLINRSLNDVTVLLYGTLKALLLIGLFYITWNINWTGQYFNWNSIAMCAKLLSFLLAFEQMFVMW